MEEKVVRLKLDDLAIGYPERTVAEGINLTMAAGEVVTLIGPNGAGKSTLLKSICGALAPLSGGVYIGERSMTSLAEAERAKEIAVVLTEKKKAELLTCYDVVSFGRYPYTGRLGLLSEKDHEKIMEAMELTGVADLAEREISALSDGQRQRVFLAGAICQDTDVIVLDEPTCFLDIKHKLTLLLLLKKLAKEREISILMSMHEVDLALKISDRLVLLKDGGVSGIVAPEELADGKRVAELYDLTPELAAMLAPGYDRIEV